jgi:mandelate racemase
MARPLGTSAQTIDRATLLLIDLDTHEGVTGRAYLFCYLLKTRQTTGARRSCCL